MASGDQRPSLSPAELRRQEAEFYQALMAVLAAMPHGTAIEAAFASSTFPPQPHPNAGYVPDTDWRAGRSAVGHFGHRPALCQAYGRRLVGSIRATAERDTESSFRVWCGGIAACPSDRRRGTRLRLPPAQVLGDRCHQLLDEAIEGLERVFQRIDREPSQAQARPGRCIRRCDPAPVQLCQPHVRPEAGAHEAHRADGHGRARVASSKSTTSARRPTSAPIVARSRTNSSSKPQVPQGTLASGSGGTAGNVTVRGLSSAVRCG